MRSRRRASLAAFFFELSTEQGDGNGDGPIDAVLLDVSSGIDAATSVLGATVIAARPAEATATQEGDVTVLTKHERL